MVSSGGGADTGGQLSTSSETMPSAAGETLVSTPTAGAFRTCNCCHEHPHPSSSAGRTILSKEDLEAFVMDNWGPALQAALGDQWKEHLQTGLCVSDQLELLPRSLMGGSAPGAEVATATEAYLESLCPGDLEDHLPDNHGRGGALGARSVEEELKHLEMTAGFTDHLRPSMPRRSVRIKRPAKLGSKQAGSLRTAISRLSMDDNQPTANPPSASREEPPRGQKRSATSLFSDAPRPPEADFVDSPEGTQPSSPSVESIDLRTRISSLDMFSQQSVYPADDADHEGPSNQASNRASGYYEVAEGAWSHSPLHMAAATGKADVVQRLLLAGIDATTWLPVDFRLVGDSPAHQHGSPSSGASPSRRASSVQPKLSAYAPEPLDRLNDMGQDFPRASSDASTVSTQEASTEWSPSQLSNKRPRSEGTMQSSDSQHQQHIPPITFDYCTSLHLAAYYGYWPVIKHLAECGNHDPAQLFAMRNAQGATALHMAAHRGHAQAVSFMSKLKECELNAVDLDGRTALHHAAALGHTAVVTELWGRGCNLELADNLGWTALHHASNAGHTEVVGMLVIAGSNVQRVDARGYTAAHLAASQGHVDVLEKLLMAGYDVDTLASVSVLGGVYNTGSSSLHLAAHSGHLPMVQRLLEAGANPGQCDYRGCTALQCAAEGGHEKVFERLAQAGCDLMSKDHLDASSLHYAASGGNWEIIQYLLDEGCEKDAVTKYGRTVLHYAAYSGKAAALQKLIDLGCDIKHADNEGNTAWHAAAQSSSVAVLRKLLEYGCPLDAINNLQCTALHYAARSGCMEMVDLLLEEGSHVHACCADGKTALHYAAQMGHEAVAVRLTENQSRELVNRQDSAKWLPLHHAAEQGKLPLVHMFLKAGSEVNAQTAEGWSALHLAARGGFTDMLNALLAACADSSLVDASGCTALHYAACKADMALFQTLYQHETRQPHLRDAKGMSVLHYAVEGGNKEIVALLLREGHGPSSQQQPAEREFTPLHLAAKAGHAELVPMLLDAGYPADGLDDKGRTPLHCAALGPQASWVDAASADLIKPPLASRALVNHMAIAVEFLGQGVDPTALDDALCSALHYASGSGDATVVRQLLSLGCSATEVDHIGWSPLMWAAAGGHADIIKELMDHGADVKIRDVRARGALHWASEKGHVKAVDLLVEKLSELALDLHAQDTDGFSAAHLAANQGHVEVVGRILDASRNHMQKGFSALHLAVQNGLDRLVQQLLVLPSTAVDARDADGLTALHWAATEGRTGIAEQLLQSRADINAATLEGCLPLHKAAFGGHLEIVKMILTVAGQSVTQVVNAKDSNGITALQQAAAEGYTELVDLFLSAGAAVNACALSNVTALYNAANGGHLDIVERLIKSAADVDSKTGTGTTPLHAAASGGHTEVVQMLLENGADVDLQAQNGSAALHNAAGGGHDATVEVLIGAGCDLDVQNSGGNTALHVAATKGHMRVVELLIAAGADFHIKNGKSLTAVGSATNNGHAEVVIRLVSSGAVWRNLQDVNVVKVICRKTNYKPSHFSGLLELAEKKKHRSKKEANVVDVRAGMTEEEVRARKEAADLQMQALIEAEEQKKAQEALKKAKKKKKKKAKKGAGSGQVSEDEDVEGEAETSAPASTAASRAVSMDGELATEITVAPSVPDPPPDPAPETATAAGASGSKSVETVSPRPGESKSTKQRQRRHAKEKERLASGTSTPRQASGEAEERSKAKKPPKGPAETLEKAAQSLDDGWTQVGHSGKAALQGSPASASVISTSESPVPPRNQLRKTAARQAPEELQPSSSQQHQQQQPLCSQQQQTRSQTPRNAVNPSRQQQGNRTPETPRQNASAAATRGPPQSSGQPGLVPARQQASQPSTAQKVTYRGEVASTASVRPAQRPILQPAKPAQPAPPQSPLRPRMTPQTGVNMGNRPVTAADPPSRSPWRPPPPAQQPPARPAGQTLSARPTALAHAVHLPVSSTATLAQQTASISIPGPQPPAASPQQDCSASLHGHGRAAIPNGSLQEQQQSAVGAANGALGTAPMWQPLSSSMTSKLSNSSHGIDWSFQGAPPAVAPVQLGGEINSMRAASGTVAEPSRRMLGFGIPKAGSVQDLSRHSRSFESIGGSHFGSSVAQRMAGSQPGSYDSEGAGRGTTAGVAPMPHVSAAPNPALSISSFSSIWGSSAPGNRNGFAGPLHQQHHYHQQLTASGTTEAEREMARRAGLCCPITTDVMREPVVASDGYTYERQAIEEWLKEHDTSPVTNAKFPRGKELVENLSMRASISLWKMGS